MYTVVVHAYKGTKIHKGNLWIFRLDSTPSIAAAMAEEMEKTLLLKQESFVYRIPQSQQGSQEWKATEWALDKPDWRGKLRLVSKVNNNFAGWRNTKQDFFASRHLSFLNILKKVQR